MAAKFLLEPSRSGCGREGEIEPKPRMGWTRVFWFKRWGGTPRMLQKKNGWEGVTRTTEIGKKKWDKSFGKTVGSGSRFKKRRKVEEFSHNTVPGFLSAG